MNEERIDTSPRGLGARCNRRQAVRWLSATGLALATGRYLAEPAGANPAPSPREPVEAPLPVAVPHDTPRVAGLGLAAAAVVVAGKLIRDKESSDPEL